MRRIYFLSADAPPSLPADRFTVANGVPNLRTILSERAAIAAFAPDILHAAGPAAVRLAYPMLAMLKPRPKFVASDVEPIGSGFLGWLTQRALAVADRVVTETNAAAVRMGKRGGATCVVVTPPPDPLPEAERGNPKVASTIPAAAKLIVCECRFDSVEPAMTAAWAFDVLKYAVPDAHLVLVGDGPASERVERFARGIAFDDFRVRFLKGNPSPDPSPKRRGEEDKSSVPPSPLRGGGRGEGLNVVAPADIVWATEPRGVRSLVTAMAAGKPIVAVASPDLVEVAGPAARFVPFGGKIALAAATRELLANPSAAAALGAAAAARSADFAPATVAARWAAVYDELFRG